MQQRTRLVQTTTTTLNSNFKSIFLLLHCNKSIFPTNNSVDGINYNYTRIVVREIGYCRKETSQFKKFFLRKKSNCMIFVSFSTNNVQFHSKRRTTLAQNHFQLIFCFILFDSQRLTTKRSCCIQKQKCFDTGWIKNTFLLLP